MDPLYYETIDRMEKRGVEREYLLGWASGFLGNPRREEQRVTDPYEAGYTDGEARVTDDFERWIPQQA